MSLDDHGQPLNRSFNYSRNVERAAWSLMGILKGISADGKLNEAEALFLNEWLRSQQYLREDGDLVDLLDLIDDILRDGIIDDNELEELLSLAEDIINYRTMDPSPTPKNNLNELLGIVNGILSDDALKDEEIQQLENWLESHPELDDHAITCAIKENIQQILADNLITDDEREHLKIILNEISGFNFTDTGCAESLSLSFLVSDEIQITTDSKTFCLTGKFLSGGRKKLHEKITSLGGRAAGAVSKKVDYLVVGTLASRDWRLTSAGQKIEKALYLKREGHPIRIISEDTWIKHLQEVVQVEAL